MTEDIYYYICNTDTNLIMTLTEKWSQVYTHAFTNHPSTFIMTKSISMKYGYDLIIYYISILNYYEANIGLHLKNNTLNYNLYTELTLSLIKIFLNDPMPFLLTP